MTFSHGVVGSSPTGLAIEKLAVDLRGPLPLAGWTFAHRNQAKTELAGINRELRLLKKHVAALEARKAQLAAEFGK